MTPPGGVRSKGSFGRRFEDTSRADQPNRSKAGHCGCINLLHWYTLLITQAHPIITYSYDISHRILFSSYFISNPISINWRHYIVVLSCTFHLSRTLWRIFSRIKGHTFMSQRTSGVFISGVWTTFVHLLPRVSMPRQTLSIHATHQNVWNMSTWRNCKLVYSPAVRKLEGMKFLHQRKCQGSVSFPKFLVSHQQHPRWGCLLEECHPVTGHPSKHCHAS